MKKTIIKIKNIVLAIMLSTISCTAQSSVHYADSLKDCLAGADISLLNEACQIFEAQLKKNYAGQKLGLSYKEFLQDIQQMNIPPCFFVIANSKAILGKIKTSKTFDKIWTKLSSVETQDDVEVLTKDGARGKLTNKLDPYCTNSNGNYLDCLTKQNKNKKIDNYLEAIKSDLV